MVKLKEGDLVKIKLPSQIRREFKGTIRGYSSIHEQEIMDLTDEEIDDPDVFHRDDGIIQEGPHYVMDMLEMALENKEYPIHILKNKNEVNIGGWTFDKSWIIPVNYEIKIPKSIITLMIHESK
jgi:hypothetical protein